MDQDTLPDEINRSITKLDKVDLRRELATGWGATTGGQALTRRYHERLTEGVRQALLDAHSGHKSEAGLVVTLRGLSPEVIALSCIQTVLHSIGMRDNLRDTLLALGENIAHECWGAKLTLDHPELARRISLAVKQRHSSVSSRYQAAKTAAAKDGFKERRWSHKALVVAGGFLWNIISSALPEVFERTDIAGSTETMLTITEGSWAIVDDAIDRMVTSNPVMWPSAQVPKPWDAPTGGGVDDETVNRNLAVLRSHHKATHAAVKHAIKTGQMQPALDALNTLQSVAFTINTKVLKVIQECVARGVMVAGLVPENKKMPPKKNAFEWGTMDAAQRGLWKRKRGEIASINRGYIGDRILFAEDMAVAEATAKHEAFYTPMNFDWRGRVYGLSHFNFQREDRVRALFLFAGGLPIGDEGLWWLKVHTANCGDFEKISKRTLEERVQWCDTHGPMITNIASDPLVHTEWMGADKPFLFLAACFELSAALAQGPSFTTRLPISFDGSCSGLQHLCAMTRAAEGAMVNLVASPLPQDVYQAVADQTKARITADLAHEPVDDKDKTVQLAQLSLDHGIGRPEVKRNTMCYSYSSKKFGMASQQQVDLMEPLGREVLEGKREDHPFEGYQHGSWNNGVQQPSKAARYIAGHVFDAIETLIHKPAEAMKFLQAIANALAHEGKPVSWTTPAGIPWINRYHEPEVSRVQLFLNDGGVKVRTQVSVATGSKKEIDKAKAANGVAPNFVHALDAAHLLLVARAAAAEGINSIATVHDSFGCLAPQAARFNAIIREQFALMYSSHDVLTEILEQASHDLTPTNQQRLPTRPINGPLDLQEITNADFAFA